MPHKQVQSIAPQLAPIDDSGSSSAPSPPKPLAPCPISNVLQRGLELQADREARAEVPEPNSSDVQPIYKPVDAKAICPACTVHKVVYPADAVQPPCRHHQRPATIPITSRVGINRQHHLNLLSTPTPTQLQPRLWPTMVTKPIHCATYRLQKLAAPRCQHVHATWSRFANVLDVQHIENCRKHLLGTHFTTPASAIECFTQKQRNAQKRRRQRHAEIKRLSREIRELQRQRYAGYAANVLTGVYRHMRPFLLANNGQMMTPERQRVSDAVLQHLGRHIGYALPADGRRSKAMFDVFLANLADNLAIYAASFAANSGYDVRAETGDATAALKKEEADKEAAAEALRMATKGALDPTCDEGIPVDDYVDYSTDDVSSIDCGKSDRDWDDMDEYGDEMDEYEFEGEDDGNTDDSNGGADDGVVSTTITKR